MITIYEGQSHDPGSLKRFTIGSGVRIKVSGIVGIVRFAGFEPGLVGEYWHLVECLIGGQSEYKHEPGYNLELTHQPSKHDVPVFDELREHAVSLKDMVQRLEFLERIEALKSVKNAPDWSKTYQALVAFASEHPAIQEEWFAPLMDKLSLWHLRYAN